jgi:hypothetical protein
VRVLFSTSSSLLAYAITAISTNPVELFNATWLPVLLGLVQVASLVFLVIYVIKTVEIAQANRKAAEATQKATEATLLSVKLSEQAVEEMRSARDAQTAPYVVVYLDMDASGFIVRLVMENLGQTAAHDISLHFDPELDAALGVGQRSEWPRFMTGVTPMLAPKQRIYTVLNSYPELVNSDAMKSSYTVSVSYHGGMSEDAQRTARTARFVLDFMSFYGVMRINENDLEKAVGKLEDLTKAVDKLREPLEGMEERLNRGVFTTTGLPTYNGADHDQRDLAVAVSLIAALKATWILIEDRNRAHIRVSDTDRQLALRTIEQIPVLLSVIQMTESGRTRARAITSELASLANQHFRRGIDVEPKIFPLLDELEALCQAEAGVAQRDDEASSDVTSHTEGRDEKPEGNPS